MLQDTAVDHAPMIAGTHSEARGLWPIPTLTVTIEQPEAFNARFAEIILEEERRIVGGAGPTEVAGVTDGLSAYWLKFNVLNWKYPEIDEFRAVVLSGLRQWISAVGDPGDPNLAVAGISCWANVLRYGERLTIHHHDPAFVSAHYTVQSGFDDGFGTGAVDAGNTVYFRPGFMDRSHGGDAYLLTSPWDDDWRIETEPKPGRLFFFPSYLRHEVRPYLGKTARISVAMDVFLKRQNMPFYYGGTRWLVP